MNGYEMGAWSDVEETLAGLGRTSFLELAGFIYHKMDEAYKQHDQLENLKMDLDVITIIAQPSLDNGLFDEYKHEMGVCLHHARAWAMIMNTLGKRSDQQVLPVKKVRSAGQFKPVREQTTLVDSLFLERVGRDLILDAMTGAYGLAKIRKALLGAGPGKYKVTIERVHEPKADHDHSDVDDEIQG
jgi:hypothetical protein